MDRHVRGRLSLQGTWLLSPGIRVSAAIDRVVDIVGGAFAWTSFLLVIVMATNVLLRYMFSIGSVWAQELEWHLLTPICLVGMAYALRHSDHVRVDIFFAKYPDRVKHLIDVAGHIAFVIVSCVIVWLSWRYVMQSWTMKEGSANPGGIDYRYMLKAFIPFGFLLLGLQSLSAALKSFERIRSPLRIEPHTQ
jgi:TRAP-type mannitol/chloroaromatic compound transport system permease small subunit